MQGIGVSDDDTLGYVEKEKGRAPGYMPWHSGFNVLRPVTVVYAT